MSGSGVVQPSHMARADSLPQLASTDRGKPHSLRIYTKEIYFLQFGFQGGLQPPMAGTRGEGSVESRHLGLSSNKYINLFCVGSTLITELLHRLPLPIPSHWNSQLWLKYMVSEATQEFY